MQIANGGGWDDDTFFNRAEIVNWEIRGAAKDCG